MYSVCRYNANKHGNAEIGVRNQNSFNDGMMAGDDKHSTHSSTLTFLLNNATNKPTKNTHRNDTAGAPASKAKSPQHVSR